MPGDQAEVWVNGRALGRRMTGVERYTQEVTRRLGVRTRILQPPRGLAGPLGHLWEQVWLPAIVPRGAVLWSPSNTGPARLARQAVTIHDLSPLEHPEWFRPSFARLYRRLLPGLAARARILIVPSEHTRQRLLACLRVNPAAVYVVPEGVDHAFFSPRRPAEQIAVRKHYRLPEEYLLAVGTLQPRKNLDCLLAAWKLVQQQKPKLGLVLVGAGGAPFRRVDLDRLPPGGPDPGLRTPGYVPNADLPALYSGALAYVCASFDEGFGLTALEAMACGTAVVVSRAGALPALVGEAGLLFDPHQPHTLADSLRTLLADPALRQQLARRGLERAAAFQWDTTARHIGELLQQAGAAL